MDFVSLLFGERRQVFGSRFPVNESVVPSLQDALVASLDFPKQRHDLFLENGSARRGRV